MSRKEVIDVQVNAAAGGTTTVSLESTLDVGQYKLVEVSGWLTSANIGAGAAIACLRVRAGVAATVVSGMSESTQALQNAAAAGTAVYSLGYGNSGDLSTLFFVPTDSFRVTSTANTGAAELHLKFVRV